TGSGQFRDRSSAEPALCAAPNVGRALAWGDLDGHGAIHLLLTAAGGRARLLRNVAPRSGHWLLVRALDPAHGGRDGVGAEVRVSAGGRTWLGRADPGGSYLCASDCRAHFGLGEATAYDSVEVRWPDGRRETFPGGPVDRVRTLRQGDGEALAD